MVEKINGDRENYFIGIAKGSAQTPSKICAYAHNIMKSRYLLGTNIQKNQCFLNFKIIQYICIKILQTKNI